MRIKIQRHFILGKDERKSIILLDGPHVSSALPFTGSSKEMKTYGREEYVQNGDSSSMK
jgi:hypothetical protein